VDAGNHIYYSNRSAAYMGLGDHQKALEDGNNCIRIKPDWPKGYFRVGAALVEMKKYDDAIAAFKRGLAVDSNNADLKIAVADAEQQRRRWLEEQAKNKPKVNADGTAFTPAQMAKEEGNKLFGEHQFERAIEAYTRAIKALTPKDSDETKASIYNNRAACHKELYHHLETVKDCIEVINLQPNNVKALIRRGMAYEALEKYQKALEDLQKAVLLEPNSPLANQALNRVRNAVRQMKK